MKKTVMKKLVKFSAIAALFLFSSLAVNAQIKVGVNGGVQLPMGDFGDYTKTGFGGGLSGKYMLNPNMGVGVNVGYYSLGKKDLILAKYETSLIPITANFTYYFSEGSFKPYAGLDLGAYMVKTKATISLGDGLLGDLFGSSLDSEVTTTKTNFGLAPTVGFEYGFTESLALDVNVKYNYILSGIPESTDDEGNTTKAKAASTVGVNVGLVYSFGGK